MADNLTTQSATLATVPANTVISTDDAGASGHIQRVKLAYSADGAATHIQADADGLLVNLGGNNDVTITGTVAVTDNSGSLTVDDGGSSITVDGTVGIGGSVAVTDNSGSLTVDAPVGTPVFVRLSDGASPITTLAVSLASLPALAAGTNNIGDVDVLTQPARSATTDTITAKLATDTIQNGTTALTPKFAAISASSSGNNTIVSAVASKKIRVLRLHLVANGAVNAKFTDGAGGADLTGLHYLTQFSGIGAAFCPVGLFETSSNTALVLNLSGAVAVGGVLTYVEV